MPDPTDPAIPADDTPIPAEPPVDAAPATDPVPSNDAGSGGEVIPPAAAASDSSAAAAPEAPAEPTAEPPREPTPEEARAQEAVAAALALLDGAASRLSAAAGGIRFSTLQKQQGSLAYEWRQMRGQEPDINALQALLGRIERLIASIGAGPRAPGEATAAPSPGALRQSLVRGMIALAPAPLHLQIEIGPDFPLAEADPLVLAARSHAVNRTALGSLRRIQWDAPDRCTLSFGDGEQRRSVVASFDAQGKLDLPPELRQNQPRPAAPKPASQSPGHRNEGRPGHKPQGRTGAEGRPGAAGQGAGKGAGGQGAGKGGGQDRPQRQGAPGGDPGRAGARDDRRGRGAPQRGPDGAGPRQGGEGRRDRDGRGGREGRDGSRRRDGRDGRPEADARQGFAARRPSFPKNTAMAEKLRAVLGPLAPAPRERADHPESRQDRPRGEGRDAQRRDKNRSERRDTSTAGSAPVAVEAPAAPLPAAPASGPSSDSPDTAPSTGGPADPSPAGAHGHKTERSGDSPEGGKPGEAE